LCDVRFRQREFQPVERAFTRQRLLGRFGLAREQSQQWVAPEFVVIVEILIAKRQPVDALLDQLLDRMRDAE
jgi:hypothetical protein